MSLNIKLIIYHIVAAYDQLQLYCTLFSLLSYLFSNRNSGSKIREDIAAALSLFSLLDYLMMRRRDDDDKIDNTNYVLMN